ncbi:hypothetical protein LguiB_031348 [Lonicera macranthoides]
MKPNNVAMVGEKREGIGIDKSFGFSKELSSRYKVGEEIAMSWEGWTEELDIFGTPFANCNYKITIVSLIGFAHLFLNPILRNLNLPLLTTVVQSHIKKLMSHSKWEHIELVGGRLQVVMGVVVGIE